MTNKMDMCENIRQIYCRSIKINKAFIVALFFILASFSSVIAQDKIGLSVNISPILRGNSKSDVGGAEAVSLAPGIGGIGIGYFLPLECVALKVSLNHTIIEVTDDDVKYKLTLTSNMLFVDYMHEIGAFVGLGILGAGSFAVDGEKLSGDTSNYSALRLGYNYKINDEILVGGGLLYQTFTYKEEFFEFSAEAKYTTNALFANVAYLF